MFKYLTKKRLLALFMSSVLVASSVQLPAAIVYAANEEAQYYLHFLDTSIKPSKESTNQRIVEGTSINILAKLPAGYEISTTAPFAVRKTGDDGDESGQFEIKKNTGGDYTLIARPGSAASSAQDYTLEALYTSTVSTATGYGSYDGENDDGAEISNRYVLDVTENPGVAITEDSAITFSANAPESEDGVLGFANVSHTTGSFSMYNGGKVVASQFKTDSGGKYSNIVVSSTDPKNPRALKMKVYFQGSARILKGTSFSIEFRRQTINSLIAAIITEKRAVDETADSVEKNPVYPDATDGGVPYIKLAQGDELDSIRANFEVLTKVHRDNVMMKLDWEWKAKKPEHQDFVKMKAGSSGKTVFEILQRPYEDMEGVVRVSSSYGTSQSTWREIPVVIYGSGDMSSVIVNSQFTGVPGEDVKEEKITEIPKIMDVYAGTADILYYDKAPAGPFRFKANLNYGSGRGRSSKAIIRSDSRGGEIEVLLDGSPTPYTLGTDIPNEGFTREIDVTAVKEGQLDFIVEFYNDNGELVKRSTVTKQINIRDSSPKTDATLKNIVFFVRNSNEEEQQKLNALYPGGEYVYTFDPATNEYNLSVPFKVEMLSVSPQIPPATNCKKDVLIEYAGGEEKVESGSKSKDIPLTVQVPNKIFVTATAEDGAINTYDFNITRIEQEKDSALQTLKAKRTDVASPEDLITDFTPEKLDYVVEVPYAAKEIELELQSRSPWVQKVEFDPEPKTTGFWLWKKEVLKFDLECEFDPVTGEILNNSNIINITVTAEDGISQTQYSVKVLRLPPSVDNTLSSLVVKDKANAEYKFDDNQVFKPEVRDYYVTIPFSAKTASIEVKAAHQQAKKITVTAPKTYGGASTSAVPKFGEASIFRNLDISQNLTAPEKEKATFDYKIQAQAESGSLTEPAYFVHFIRVPPDADTRLASLDIVDQDGKAITDFTFKQEQLEYNIVVPYTVKSVTATPKALSPLAKVAVNGAELSDKRLTYEMKLAEATAKTLAIEVTAESADKETYKVNITKALPGKEARLADLKVDAMTLKPKFNPNILAYEIVIPLKTKGYTVTPTAVDENAVITVDTKVVKSGSPSQKISPVEVMTQTVIDVTAQDGKTKLRYLVNVRDENLVEKSSDADLESLKVFDGSLSPRFKKGILDYEIALKSDTVSLDLVPKLVDANAKLEVSQGTKQLENYDGVFSTAITEDETEFKVKVTSSDTSKIKEYKLIAYRNNEEKAGIYKPITADMVNFEGEENPIKVDISKYAIVKAEVFNTLKTEYPDKSILLQSTDYSLLINGKDIPTLVPNTEEYDFTLSYNGPNNQVITDLIHNLDARNAPLQPVIAHFAHHGALPAPMQLTLSLGGYYKNLRMYWNYYNEEATRIDYYGFVNTNAQGSFTIPITHLSDYPVTTGMVYGSENKVGTQGYDGENLSAAGTDGKKNPKTNYK